MGYNFESLLRAADTVGKLERPAALQGRLAIVAALLRDAPAGEGPRLLWRGVENHVHTHRLDRDLLIGRDPACDLVLASPMVSRRHCRLLCKSGHILLRDLGSTHGTSINGVTEKQSVVTDGDIVQIGETALIFSSV